MRVFVVGTGRCGSVSFHEACKFITNFGTGHESRSPRLEYPRDWIEVSPHLRCCITTLCHRYPFAKWVHLIREPQACIESLAALDHGEVMQAYGVLFPSIMDSEQPNDIAYRYYWSENDSIAVQLKSLVTYENRMTLNLETIKDQWHWFWQWIKADGDLQASLNSWDVRYNTREQRGEL